MSSTKAAFAFLLLVFIAVTLISSWVSLSNARERCDADNGILVRGTYGEGTSFSGHVCIEEGQH